MASVYVQRGAGNAVIGLYTGRQPGIAEEVADDHDAEIAAFRDRADPVPRNLAAEIDALAAKLARAEAAEAALIEKAIVTKGEIDAKLPAIDVAAVKG